MQEVLIVGAGPSGLFTAIEMIRQGFSPRLIDKSLEPTKFSKAIAIQARTLEIFDQIGIVESFLSKGKKIRAANAIFHGEKLAHLPLDTIESPYPFILSLAQSETERILTEHLYSLGAKIERGVELLSFREVEDGVLAKTSQGEEKYSWLIGCDGAHSTTRKTLGVNFAGRAIERTFALADVRVKWDFPYDEFFLVLNEEGVLAAIPLPEKERIRLIFQDEATVDKAQALLQRYACKEAVVSDPKWLSTFTINSRIAKKYMRGRVFLVGDAAHIHSPAGGQGMNTGIQDGFNLAWKLFLVDRKKAPYDLLFTYEKERKGFGEKLLFITERVTRISMLKNPFLIRLRNRLFSFLTSKKKIQKALAAMLSQSAIHYPKSLAVGLDAGMRAPPNKELYDLLRKTKGFVLLTREKAFSLQWERVAFLKLSAPSYDPRFSYVIRPDGVIGSKTMDLRRAKRYLEKIFSL